LALRIAVPILKIFSESTNYLNEIQRSDSTKRVLFCSADISHIWHILDLSNAIGISLFVFQMEYD